MPGLRDRKKLESWRSIRAAALRLFEVRGFDAVSVDDIAREADVSRTTFFNYFASKEAVVFDPDPEDRDELRKLLLARPADEALWLSLQAVLAQNLNRYADRLALQKKLKAQSPKLAGSARDMTDNFRRDLHDWAASRAAEDSDTVMALQINVAMTVVGTAYEHWDPDQPFSDLLDLVPELFAASPFAFTS